MNGFNTRAIHVGSEPDPSTGAVNTPVYLTSTYAQDAVGVVKFSDYARGDNPTRAALEACLASLEGAKHGVAFASGLAGEDALLRTLSPGDHVLLGPRRLRRHVSTSHPHLWRVGHRSRLRGPGRPRVARGGVYRPDQDGLGRDAEQPPACTWCPSRRLAATAHEHGAKLVVDNTFASPYLQQPLALGADVVVHSTTKYIGGHSDVLGGFVATNDDELAAKLKFHQYAIGAVPGPLDCYLLLRGVKTLGVRMDRHCSNARAVAAFLSDHSSVERVYYPGLADSPWSRRGAPRR